MSAPYWAIAQMLYQGGSADEIRGRRLMNISAAVAAMLLLAAGNLMSMTKSWSSPFAGLVAEEGLRSGTSFALAVLVLPVMAFAYQAGRVTQTSRERRLAALRLAGASPRDVRLISAYESARTSIVGAVLGCCAYIVLREALLLLSGGERSWFAYPPILLPLTVVLVVGTIVFLGHRAGRQVIASPLGLTRRAPRPKPRARGMALVVIGVALMPIGMGTSVAISYTGALLAFVGLFLSTSWLIALTGRLAARLGRRPETLLAGRGLAADPRAWGRTVSVIAMVVMVGTGVVSIQLPMLMFIDELGFDAFSAVSLGLANLALLFALVVVTASLVVHRAEWLMDNRRSLASLSAAGVSARSLHRAAVRQTSLAVVPASTMAAFAGAFTLNLNNYLDWEDPAALWRLIMPFPYLGGIVMVVLAWSVARMITGLGRSRLHRAIAPANLRTE